MLKFMPRNETTRNVMIGFIVAALSAYVLVGFGEAPATAPNDTIAKMGSVKIMKRDALIQQENVRNSLSVRGQNLKPEDLYQYTTNQLMVNAILRDGAASSGVIVSDEELKDEVIRNRTFSDGNFATNEQWSDNIKYRYRMQVESFESYLKTNQLTTRKYQNLFLNSAFVDESDARERFLERNQKVKIELMTLNTYEVKNQVTLNEDSEIQVVMDAHPEEFQTGDQRQVEFVALNLSDYEDKEAVTDEMIKKYYDDNSARYQRPNQVKASHILIKTEKRTEEEALAEATRIKKELDEGLDFAEAAKKYSDDAANKDRGGDLGVFGRDRMVKPFEEKAFSMAIGDVSEPVKTQFGYHIIKKFDATLKLENVSSSIKNNIARDDAREKAKEIADKFHKAVVGGAEFAEAAKTAEVNAEISNFFDNDNRSDMGETLKNRYQVRRAVFDLKEMNDITGVLDAGNMIVVARWIAKEAPRPLELPLDKARAKTIAENLAAADFIKDLYAEIRAAAEKEPEKSFKDFKGDRDFLKDNHFKTTDWVGATTLPYEIDRKQVDFEKDIYALAPGDFVENAKSAAPTRHLLVRLVEKQEADMSKYEEERMSLIDQLRRENGSDLLGNYIYSKNKEYGKDGKIEARLLTSFQQR